jgi:hypothetical protein
MKSNARGPIVVMFALLATLLSVNAVLAADYSVDFGAEADAGHDAGTLTCPFDEMCSGKLESLGLRVSLIVFRSHPDAAHVHLYGSDISCCYFDGAADSVTVDPRQPQSRVPFFRGARAKGALFMENKRMGILYLRFHFFRDHPR